MEHKTFFELTLSNIIPAVIYLIAGSIVFLIFLGRVLLSLIESRRKRHLIRFFFFLLVITPLVGGYFAGLSWGLSIPIAIICCAIIGEFRRIYTRKELLAEKPVLIKSEKLPFWMPLTTFELAERFYEIDEPRLPCDRFRIAHISDLHLHRYIPNHYFPDVADRINALDPDIIVITGDFVSNKKNVGLIADTISPLKARHGVYAILGNHDHWTYPELITEEVRKGGAKPLMNTHEWLHFPDGDIILSGCEDPWGPSKWQVPARKKRELLLVLTHTADNIHDLVESDSDIVFAGHYHAGQGRIPFLGSVIIPSKFGRLFDHGHFKIRNTHLFVTAGVGAAMPPFRIYCQPEIIIVDILKGSMRTA